MSARLRLILITSIILLICLGGFLIATSMEWYPFMWFLLVPGIALLYSKDLLIGFEPIAMENGPSRQLRAGLGARD